MFASDGLKISQLILLLKHAQQEHGDIHVHVGGGDYPEGVTTAQYVATNRPYHPENTLYLS